MSSYGPQMVVGSRLLSLGYVPADAGAVTALAPGGVRLHHEQRAVLTQYVVDTAIQTSGVGAHSATLIGIDLDGGTTDDDTVPPRMWVGAIVSTPQAQDMFAARGVPTQLGRTTITIRGDAVVALTAIDDVPVVRTVATVGAPTVIETGDLIYVRETPGGVAEDTHPWIATIANHWELTSLEFTATTGAFERLRPAEQPTASWGLYAPNAAFCYPATANGRLATPGDTHRPAAAPIDPWGGRFRGH